jgi:hypothetical protein
MKRKFLALCISVVISCTGLFGLLLSVPSTSAGASGSTPGCTATPKTSCTFVPSGTVINYVAHIHGSSTAFIEEFDPTCTTFTGNVAILGSSAPRTGTFTLNTAGDCIFMDVLGHARITASG